MADFFGTVCTILGIDPAKKRHPPGFDRPIRVVGGGEGISMHSELLFGTVAGAAGDAVGFAGGCVPSREEWSRRTLRLGGVEAAAEFVSRPVAGVRACRAALIVFASDERVAEVLAHLSELTHGA